MMDVNNITMEDWLKATFPEWGTWLNEEIDAEIVPKNNFAMWWLGCMGIWLKSENQTNLTIDFWCGTGKRTKTNKYMAPNHQYRKMCGCSLNQPNRRVTPIVIDPFAVKSLEAFLCTHYHSDHIDPYVTGAVLQNCPQAKFIGPRACVDIWKQWNVPEDKCILVKPGDVIKIKDITINVLKSFDRTIEFSAYPVENFNATMDDKAVNYLIETSGGNLYHAGDSHYSNQFALHGNKYNVDVALGAYAQNPRGLTDKLNTSDILRMAEDLNTKVIIPMHYDTWSNFQSDVSAITMLYKLQKERLNYKFHPFIWQIGGKYTFPQDIDKTVYNYDRGFSDVFTKDFSWPYDNFM
ncbi:MAG: L-ascorbate 6-phosphate lactonase [Selenomonadaceae bacterium]|nr:L-ascorbate 6-phosphate lactonase [Selenomonadaceae bacterium]